MAIMIRSSTDAETFITTFPGILILGLGILLFCIILFGALCFFGYFACVMGNGITHCCRRARKRREEKRERREEKRERRRVHQQHPVTVPEPAHLPPSSSINFNGSHRPTHGSSARIAGSDSLYDTPADGVSGTRSQIAAWNGDLERGLTPDNASVHTRVSSQSRARPQERGRSSSVTSRSQAPISIRDDTSMYSSSSTQRRNRLQKGYRGRRAGTLSHGSLSQMGSVGSSSRLFDDRGSIDQRSTSAQGLLSERH